MTEHAGGVSAMSDGLGAGPGGHSAVYVGGRLVAPGNCPICGGRLVDLRCQRPTCGRSFGTLEGLQAAYDDVARIVAALKAPNVKVSV